eukprot:CAMPEP_0203889738 /NCGR_PEP_ID=MMETSP0359-20131031/33270_1 /ASSEMBLY_ACC=CAM_ASM_000338 /TAXON_ID=268821 /ORGANISM="Scrippsiella Hangoei, Strain SHTV-5" /LENGTH=175 /DNA_ID=CAMNT_0050811211 /DNA_START=84 /DNA_END=608 /DNA_ORIENTATION=+
MKLPWQRHGPPALPSAFLRRADECRRHRYMGIGGGGGGPPPMPALETPSMGALPGMTPTGTGPAGGCMEAFAKAAFVRSPPMVPFAACSGAAPGIEDLLTTVAPWSSPPPAPASGSLSQPPRRRRPSFQGATSSPSPLPSGAAAAADTAGGRAGAGAAGGAAGGTGGIGGAGGIA